MADPFVAEIRIFPFNFAPKGWAWCTGQILPISQNTALFSLLGTTYGGDGKSTFALPDLQGSAPMHPGEGPGLSAHDLGESGGTDTVSLLPSEMPVHTHFLQVSTSDASALQPGPSVGFARGKGVGYYDDNTQPTTTMHPSFVTTSGSSAPHNNLMPYLTYYFNIALQGVFPPRG